MMSQLPQPNESIAEHCSRLVADVRTFVNAQVAVYRLQLAGWLGQARIIALLGISAVVLANAALIALLVGLIVTLGAHIGAGWATLVVVAATLAVAGVLGWLAAGRVGRLAGGDES